MAKTRKKQAQAPADAPESEYVPYAGVPNQYVHRETGAIVACREGQTPEEATHEAEMAAEEGT